MDALRRLAAQALQRQLVSWDLRDGCGERIALTVENLLRVEPKAVELVQDFFDAKKTLAAVCHAPWLLIEADLLRAEAAAGVGHSTKAVINIHLSGGPSHQDMFDLKMDAPSEVRGEFKPISTKVPGIQICEHLPKLAQQMDKLCLLRSMTHSMNVHGPACSEVYSGREYFGPPTTDHDLLLMWGRYQKASTSFSMDEALAEVPHLIAYSAKANGNLAVLRTLNELGAGADIVSLLRQQLGDLADCQ